MSDKTREEINLHSTMDASVWAEEFIRIFAHRRDEIDEGLMIGWFANSIMTGYDHATSKFRGEIETLRAQLEKCDEGE